MPTQQTFDRFIFQFRPWLPTEYLVDKWHNQCMDIWWCTNTFVHRLYIRLVCCHPCCQYSTYLFQLCFFALRRQFSAKTTRFARSTRTLLRSGMPIQSNRWQSSIIDCHIFYRLDYRLDCPIFCRLDCPIFCRLDYRLDYYR